jgi:hypothetical protein
LDATNERITKGNLKNWGDNVVTKPVEAMLIRADGMKRAQRIGRKRVPEILRASRRKLNSVRTINSV